MAELIKENIYVDNLLMTAATQEEAVQHCKKAQQIPAEMNTNLCEFRTSCSQCQICQPMPSRKQTEPVNKTKGLKPEVDFRGTLDIRTAMQLSRETNCNGKDCIRISGINL
ncbi:hypothetical protein V3C99_001655 [Haemonchus contortus]